MKILGVIPARYESSRLPGKPLLEIKGISMIRRVYAQCQQATSLTDVIVATDDKRILDHLLEGGAKAVMTSTTHQTGTQRVNEVAEKFPEYDYYINIQGDEPFIDPSQIDLVAKGLTESGAPIITLIKRSSEPELFASPHTVKVVVDNQYRALYFSRSEIPFGWKKSQGYFYKHIGIYGFSREILERINELKPSSLADCEKLEQLQWLENGIKIGTLETEVEGMGIDVPSDLEKAHNFIIENE